MDSGLKTPVPDEAPAPEPGTLPGQAQKGPHLHGLASAVSPPVTCVCSALASRLTSGHPLPLSPACLAAALSGAGCWPCFTDGRSMQESWTCLRKNEDPRSLGAAQLRGSHPDTRPSQSQDSMRLAQ